MSKKCIVTLGSVTTAIKVEKIFFEHNIQCKIIKLDPTYTEKGCAYGIEIPLLRKLSAEKLLSSFGIHHNILTL